MSPSWTNTHLFSRLSYAIAQYDYKPLRLCFLYSALCSIFIDQECDARQEWRKKSKGSWEVCCWLFGWSYSPDSHLPNGGNIRVINTWIHQYNVNITHCKMSEKTDVALFSLCLFSTGAEDSSHIKENRPILRNSRLCQTDHTERGAHSLLQGLSTQLAEYCPLRRHRLGCLWGQRIMKAHSFHSASLWGGVSSSSHSLYSTDSEVFLAEQKQRFSWPRGHGACRLRCRFQHMWAAGKLPSGTDPHPNAGARSG